jgi:hypothetical protein
MKRTMYLLALALVLGPLSMVGCGSDSGTTPTGDAGGTGGHLDGGGSGGNDGSTHLDMGASDVVEHGPDAPAPLDTQAIDGPKVIDSGTHIDSTGVDTAIAVDVTAPLDVAAPLDTGAAEKPAVIDAAAID